MAGLVQTLRGLGAARLVAIVIVTAAMIGFFTYLTNHVATPNLSLLYTDLDLRDSGQIVQKLEGMSIPYQVRGDGGQILVPSEQVAKLRMAMAEAGLPHGGSIGYEIFDKIRCARHVEPRAEHQPGARARGRAGAHHRVAEPGASRRASISCCRGASCSRASARSPSASIVIKMRGAERLGRSQVAAIQHLVASAVPGLKPTHVAIVDGDGKLLARGDGDGADDGGGGNAEESASTTRTAWRARSRS